LYSTLLQILPFIFSWPLAQQPIWTKLNFSGLCFLKFTLYSNLHLIFVSSNNANSSDVMFTTFYFRKFQEMLPPFHSCSRSVLIKYEYLWIWKFSKFIWVSSTNCRHKHVFMLTITLQLLQPFVLPWSWLLTISAWS
jgi:hypothetical protein